ncbi:hypothetical protein ACFW9F_07430 [Streptomyces sp. NPDC059506]|uniref:hypothetical protein n=1 Tax=Streptomyces TaxID=1883 RepID=UPI000CB70F49|nr:MULTISPECIES: hypothetical protein [unclassified Streptomyces]MCZ2524547.1 hypothetical protein [Streptomyces sp. HB2AG]PLW74625.1 hypothetical protein C0036_00905 [Streptomyces sp. DJ]QMV23710.1 hypothetical protein GQS52_20195 [Streptomyces sp. SCUT-3]
MYRYRLTFLLFFAPFMLVSGVGNLQEAGWSRLWGVCEVALALAVSIGAAKEIRDGRKRRDRA